MKAPSSSAVTPSPGIPRVSNGIMAEPTTQTKAVVNRLARAIGHLESVKSMVENGRDCTEVLIQLAAVRAALSSTAKVILKDHLEHCISEDGANTEEQLRALNDAIDKFMQ